MPDATPAVLQDVYAYLDALVQEGASPDTARARLQPLRARHPGADIDVVWEEQAFDGSMHFDALIRPGTAQTISLSVCPDRDLPWPLRGLQRWKDSDLLRVNGVVLSVADAIAQLDALWERAPLMQRLIDRCLVDERLSREPLEVSDDEIQHAFDTLRRSRGLLTPAAFEAWMKDSGVSWATLEGMATQLARTARLRERTVGHRVDAVLADDLAGFDLVALATVQTRAAEAAQALREAAVAGGRGLLHAAQEMFARHPDVQVALRRVRRHQLDNAVARALAAYEADAGAALPPVVAVADGEVHLLAEVLQVEPARADDPEVRRAAAARLYEEWLREQRRAARIEWFWGRTDGAPGADVVG
jgi:putative peptide maturation system protein